MNWDQIQSNWLAMTRRVRADLGDEQSPPKAPSLPGRARIGKTPVGAPEALPNTATVRKTEACDRLPVE
jgi:hypothetical protein